MGNTRDGRKVVAAAGTAERLVAANTPCRRVTIQALPTNTGYIAIGDSTVVANTAGSVRGLSLSASNSVTLHVEDLYQLFVDAEVSAEGVSFIYEF